MITNTEATPTTVASDPCLLPKEIGFCEPSDSGIPITRFFFDNEQSKKCQAFTFVGCGGNENNFITKHECQAVCQPSIDDPDQEVNDYFGAKIQTIFNTVFFLCSWAMSSLIRWKTRSSSQKSILRMDFLSIGR